VQFVKAATLDEALETGQVTRFAPHETALTFDMDGTLVDMRDEYPKELMDTLQSSAYAASDKVVVTAADNRLGCGAVTESLLAPNKVSQMPASKGFTANGDFYPPSAECEKVVQGASGDESEMACHCPENFFVNGLDPACRDHGRLSMKPIAGGHGEKCYCEPDLFNIFGIDPVAECPEMVDSKGHFMIAKPGVVMARYAKAEGVTAYYKDETLSRGKQFKQIVFLDDWVENPVNFAEEMCFNEAPPGLEHLVSVWYATDRMEEREKEKMARLKAGKMAADNSEGNYFHPNAWNDARLAGMRIVFGVKELQM
jgi:hypothetical protein